MQERERARKALLSIPPTAREALESAVQAVVEGDMGGMATPELLYRAAGAFEARTGAMRIMEAAVAHLFAAVLIRRAEELRAAGRPTVLAPRHRVYAAA